MLILNVISPASSFETTIDVMSGAAGSSPVESVNVCEFAFARALLARADEGIATTVRSEHQPDAEHQSIAWSHC